LIEEFNSFAFKVITNKKGTAKHQWLTLTILTTLEVEIRRIIVRGQPGQIGMRPHFQNNKSKMDWRCGSNSKVPILEL
jgi:hypothetical protein